MVEIILIKDILKKNCVEIAARILQLQHVGSPFRSMLETYKCFNVSALARCCMYAVLEVSYFKRTSRASDMTLMLETFIRIASRL